MVAGVLTSAQIYQQRFVVLGASNIRRARLPLAKIFLENFSGPVDVVLVGGHGRSFVKTSRVLGWQLPAVCDSKWREQILRYPAGRSHAIVTDVGNDLFYRRSIPEILGSVELSIHRIGSIDRGVVVGPPMERLRYLRPSQFQFLRSLFFPRSSVTFSDALRGAEELATGLEQIAKSLGFSYIQPGVEWYGWDPIHIRWTKRETFWRTIIGDHFPGSLFDVKNGSRSDSTATRLGLKENIQLVLSRSHTQRWFSIERGARQPWLTRSDGSTVSFY